MPERRLKRAVGPEAWWVYEDDEEAAAREDRALSDPPPSRYDGDRAERMGQWGERKLLEGFGEEGLFDYIGPDGTLHLKEQREPGNQYPEPTRRDLREFHRAIKADRRWNSEIEDEFRKDARRRALQRTVEK